MKVKERKVNCPLILNSVLVSTTNIVKEKDNKNSLLLDQD